MRTGTTVAIVIAVAVVAASVFSFNDRSDPVVPKEEREEAVAPVARDEDDAPVVRDEDDAARDAEMARDEKAASANRVARETEAKSAGEDRPPATSDTEGGSPAAEDAGPAATDPEELLTPANFERDEVLDLIDGADELTGEDRSALRALVDRAAADPSFVETAVASIRAALDLPPLE